MIHSKSLIVFQLVSSIFIFCFFTEPEFHWEPERLFREAGVHIEMRCIEVIDPLTIIVTNSDNEHFMLKVAGIKLLKSVENVKYHEVTEFVTLMLLNKEIKISHFDYTDENELSNYIKKSKLPEVLLWINDDILWNLAMVLNGYAFINCENNILAPYIRVCGCQ